MSEFESPVLSPQQFLELESICDAFEQELLSGRRRSIATFVANASPEIRIVLCKELNTLLMQHGPGVGTKSTEYHQDTVTPDDFETLLGPRDAFQTAGSETTESENDMQLRFGRFWLHSIVGRGGNGVVWKAFDQNLDRWVALKVSFPNTIADSKRFVREAQAVARLKHPNIIPVFEAGELNGKCYLVSEFCDGRPLSSLIDGKPFESKDAVRMVISIAEAISHSHQEGTIHRDIKPHNIVVLPDGTPMVTDFGLARNLMQDQTLTLEGELVGTPAYMAPEQAKGGPGSCGTRADIYSLGAVLFQLLTGKAPFTGSLEQVLFQVINTPAADITLVNPQVPKGLAAICAKCLEKSPERRFQSVDDLLEELRRFHAGQKTQTRSVSWMGKYSRWIQREPAIACTTTIAGFLLFVVAAGSIVSAWSMTHAWRKEKQLVLETQRSLAAAIEARQQEATAKSKAEAAEKNARKNAQLNAQMARANRLESVFLTNVFSPLDLIGVNQVYPHQGKMSRLMSAQAIEYATGEAERNLNDAPVVCARVKGMLGNAWRSHGQFDKAEMLLTQATQLLQKHGDSNDPLWTNDFAVNQMYWGYFHHHLEDMEKAEQNYRESIELFQLARKYHEDSAVALQLAQAEFGLGALFLKQRLNDLAKPFIESSLAKRRKHLAKGDSLLLATELTLCQCNPDMMIDAAHILQSADSTLTQKAIKLYWEIIQFRKQKDYSEAIDRYEELLTLITTSIGKHNSIYLLAIGDFAGLLQRAGDYKRALQFATEAISQSANLARWHPQRMRAMMLFAHELQLAGRYVEARDMLLEVNENPSPKWNDADSLQLGLAWCHFYCGDVSDAVSHSRIALRSIGTTSAASDAWIYYTHAMMLEAYGETDAAEELHDKALSIAEKMISDSSMPQHSTWLKRIGTILSHHQLHQQSEVVYRQAIECAENEYVALHPRVAGLQVDLATVLIDRNMIDQAGELLQDALAIQSVSLPHDDPRMTNIRHLLEQVSTTKGSQN